MSEIIDIFAQTAKEEQECALFGHELYEIRDKLPSLDITVINHEDYFHATNLMIKLCNEFGEYLTNVFADLCFMYDIKEIDDTQTMEKESIRLIYLVSRGFLTFGLKQAESINHKIRSMNMDSDDIEIPGSEYYMIAICLQSLPYAFHSLINFVHNRRYYDDGYRISISERQSFLISLDYERLRKIFMTVQCFELKRDLAMKPTTVH